MQRQTCGCVTYAKLSRQNTDPSFSDTFTWHFLKQNSPKTLATLYTRFLLKNSVITLLSELVFFLKLGVLW